MDLFPDEARRDFLLGRSSPRHVLSLRKPVSQHHSHQKLGLRRLNQFVLVTGGTRSGKSRFAVDLAKRFGGRVVYVATCEAEDHPTTCCSAAKRRGSARRRACCRRSRRWWDQEMRQRIAHHKLQRPRHWCTIEHPADPAKAIAQLDGTVGGVIIDCLTMYVSRLLVHGDSDGQIVQKVRQLCTAIRRAAFPVILVTNEVGSSVVPEHPLGRRFRDLAGLANQIAAQAADQVVLMVAGIPVHVKG